MSVYLCCLEGSLVPLLPPCPCSLSPPPCPPPSVETLAKTPFRRGAQEVLPLVLRMASDPVPNIRFNVSKTLERMAPCLEVRFLGFRRVPDMPGSTRIAWAPL